MIRINKMGNEILFDEIYRWGMRYYLFGPVILLRYNFAFSDTRLAFVQMRYAYEQISF